MQIMVGVYMKEKAKKEVYGGKGRENEIGAQ